MLSSACTGGVQPELPDGVEPTDGMQPTVQLVEVEPDGGAGFVWTSAYRLGELPIMNVGYPVDRDPSDIRCVGEANNIACAEAVDGIDVIGVRFDGNVAAWAWLFVPEDATQVRVTAATGDTSIETPRDGVVIVPVPVCPCTFEALDPGGQVIDSRDF